MFAVGCRIGSGNLAGHVARSTAHYRPAADANGACVTPAAKPHTGVHSATERHRVADRVAQNPISPHCRRSRRPARRSVPRSATWTLVVLMLAALVHSADIARAGSTGADKLPALVTEMRDRLLAAVASGRIEDLREPLEWNEMPFMFQDGVGDLGDPIAYWKKISSDGTGGDVLAAIGRMLALPPARLAIGRDAENTAVYVWPYLSEHALDRLSSAEEKDLLSLMPQASIDAMRQRNKWTWWRLVIGADGTWHALKKDE